MGDGGGVKGVVSWRLVKQSSLVQHPRLNKICTGNLRRMEVQNPALGGQLGY